MKAAWGLFPAAEKMSPTLVARNGVPGLAGGIPGLAGGVPAQGKVGVGTSSALRSLPTPPQKFYESGDEGSAFLPKKKRVSRRIPLRRMFPEEAEGSRGRMFLSLERNQESRRAAAKRPLLRHVPTLGGARGEATSRSPRRSSRDTSLVNGPSSLSGSLNRTRQRRVQLTTPAQEGCARRRREERPSAARDERLPNRARYRGFVIAPKSLKDAVFWPSYFPSTTGGGSGRKLGARVSI